MPDEYGTSAVPASPKIYHFTHMDNLSTILGIGGLLSDHETRRRNTQCATVGMNTLKERRLTLPVYCHPNTFVGQYVPFYFCSRSPMLYVLYKADAVDLHYRGGQRPLIHLEADLHSVVNWAAQSKPQRKWAFTTANAAAYTTVDYYNDLDDLSRIRWDAMTERQWGGKPEIKQAKFSEFLVHRGLPWHLIERIGVIDNTVKQQVELMLGSSNHIPQVQALPDWYY